MDDDALRIHELVVEAGALLDWLESGRVPAEAAWGTLDALRDELCMLAEHAPDAEACEAARGTVSAIDAALRVLAAPLREGGAA